MKIKKDNNISHYKKSVYQKTLKIDYLKRVQTHLQNGVYPYFEVVKNIRDEKQTAIGFHELARLIFPIIDALAKTIYKPTKNYKLRHLPIKLLSKLGIRFPYLVWEMFRHPIIHSDTFRGASYKDQNVKWAIKAYGGEHMYFRNHIGIDLQTLYNDLLKLIDKEKLGCKPNQYVDYEYAVKFTNEIDDELKEEFRKIKLI